MARVPIDQEVHMKAAVEAEAIGNDEEAIVNYILCDALDKVSSVLWCIDRFVSCA